MMRKLAVVLALSLALQMITPMSVMAAEPVADSTGVIQFEEPELKEDAGDTIDDFEKTGDSTESEENKEIGSEEVAPEEGDTDSEEGASEEGDTDSEEGVPEEGGTGSEEAAPEEGDTDSEEGVPEEGDTGSGEDETNPEEETPVEGETDPEEGTLEEGTTEESEEENTENSEAEEDKENVEEVLLEEMMAEAASIDTENAVALEGYIQPKYFRGKQGYSLFIYANMPSWDSSVTELTNVAYQIDEEEMVALGNVFSDSFACKNPNYSWTTCGNCLTLSLASKKSTAQEGSHQLTVYFTVGDIGYKVTGETEFVDEFTKEDYIAQVADEAQYFSAKSGSTIEKIGFSSWQGAITYRAGEEPTTMQLIKSGTTDVVAYTGKVLDCEADDEAYCDNRYENYNYKDSNGVTYYPSSAIIPREAYGMRIYYEKITLKNNIEEGYYDVVLVTSKGRKIRYAKVYYASNDTIVYGVNIEDGSQFKSDSYDYYSNLFYPDNSGNYVSVFVYGLGVNSSNVPTFYGEDGSTVLAQYDANDPNCGYEYGSKWGSYFTLKKTDAAPENEEYVQGNVAVTGDVVTAGELGSDFVCGNAYLRLQTDESVKYYLGEGAGCEVGETVSVEGSVLASWDTYEDLSWTGIVQSDNNGKYIEIPSSSEVYQRLGAFMNLALKKGEERVADLTWYSYKLYAEEIKQKTALKVPANCTWEIHAIGEVASTLYQGKTGSSQKSVLNSEQIVELARRKLVRVCIYNANGSLKSRDLVTFKADRYTITYQLNGGTNHEENPVEYYKGEVITINSPIKAYADFAGWFTDKKCTKRFNGIKASTQGNLTLYAKWTPYKYSISYDANGGSGSMEKQACNYGTEYTLRANKFTRRGYTFMGWNTIKNPTEENPGVVYSDKQAISNLTEVNDESLTLYAQWSKDEYRIIYHLAGGYNVYENASIYTIDNEVVLYAPETTHAGVYFDGWYKENGYKNRIEKIEKGSVGDVHLYAKWIPHTYQIIFDSNAPEGATVSGNQAAVTASYHSDITLPKNNFKCTGYTFGGWSLSKEVVNGIATYANKELIKTNLVEPQSNDEGKVTLYAVWQNKYDITYHLNEGSFAEEEAVITEYEYKKASNLPNPERAGYTFGGWYKDMGFENKVTAITNKMYGDLELYAKWTPYNYSIVFKGNEGASGKMSAQNMKSGKTKTLSQNKFSKKGYVFAGWMDVAGNLYGDKEQVSFIPSKNQEKIVLTAQWMLENYQITYETDGGILDRTDVTETYTYGEKITLPTDDKIGREGYVFAGWYKDKNYTKKITAIESTMAQDITVYAKWTAEYTIEFYTGIEGMDGITVTGTMTSQAMDYEKADKIKKNAFNFAFDDNAELACAFVGWSTEPMGEVLYADEQKIVRPENLELNEEGKLVLKLYAVWRTSFDVTFETNGGELDSKYDDWFYMYKVGKTKSELSQVVPVRDGYKFAGWYSDAKCKTKVESISRKQKKDITLYAKWTGKAYTITYNKNLQKATGKISNQKMIYGKEKALEKCKFKAKGYEFTGWSLTPGGDVYYGPQEKVSGPVQYTSKLTLYAVWEKTEYTISYRNVDEEMIVDYPQSYDVETDTIYLGDYEPERMGYTFLGWYSDAKYKKPITQIKKGSTGKKILYAKWKAN